MKFPRSITPDGLFAVGVMQDLVFSFLLLSTTFRQTGRHSVVPDEGVVCFLEMTKPLIDDYFFFFIAKAHNPHPLPSINVDVFSLQKTANHLLLMAFQLSFFSPLLGNLWITVIVIRQVTAIREDPLLPKTRFLFTKTVNNQLT